MAPELFYLLLTAILTGVLWIPVVIGKVLARGPLKPGDYKVERTTPLPDWVNRANRAHMNAVENFGQFAAVVLIAHAIEASSAVTAIAAMVYFEARLVHAVVHIAGVSLFMARTLLFTISWIAFLVIAVEVLRKSL